MRSVDAGRRVQEACACAVTLFTLLVAALLPGTATAAGEQAAPAGIDVSHWNGQIDWLGVAASGYSFVFANATDGQSFQDAAYPLERSGAAGIGLRFGAYHFGRPSGASDPAVVASARAQADAFLAYARPQPGDLLPALDLEETGGLSSARLTEWAQSWLDEIAVRLGVNAIVYASPKFWQTALGDTPLVAAAGDPLWIAHWTAAALPILPGAGWGGFGWTFWQWSDCQHVMGIAHCVDGDRFNGDSLSTAAIGAYPSGPPTAVTAPSILGNPQTAQLLAAAPGSWGGGKPVSFAYQWQRCEANGTACTPITGAISATYKPTSADVGHAVALGVTAETAAGSTAAVSAPTVAVAGTGAAPAAAPKPIVPPSVEGTTEAGQTLSGLVGTWKGAPTGFGYAWRRCDTNGAACTAIAGASGMSYTLTPGDIGSRLSLVVTATGRGGSRSANAAPSAVISPAPLPTPAVGTAVAAAGQAGAVTSPDNAATVSWQPGAVPAQSTVSLGPSASRLAIPGTSLALGIGATAPLPWPVDVEYPAAQADAIPGFLPGAGVWQPIAQLTAAMLPAGQEAGTYRDSSGAVHILTRTPARLALFAPGKWGDPRFVPGSRPSLILVSSPVVTPSTGGTMLLRARFTLDSQAHLYASLIGANGARAILPQHGTRLGWWLQGQPTKTLQTLQLRPGEMPIRVRLPDRTLTRPGGQTLQIVAVDPYGRHARLSVRLPSAGR